MDILKKKVPLASISIYVSYPLLLSGTIMPILDISMAKEMVCGIITTSGIRQKGNLSAFV